jgi:5-methylcytosine-specific restriction endonuclease McrA
VRDQKKVYYLAEILINDVIGNHYNIITYSNLGYALSKKYGITIPPQEVSQQLEYLTMTCFENGFPLISGLVVERETYQPNESFFRLYRQLFHLQVINSKQVHVDEVKKIMAHSNWNALLTSLQSSKKEVYREEVIAEIKPESTGSQPTMQTEETFKMELDKRIKESVQLGPVLRRDRMKEYNKSTPRSLKITKEVYDVNTDVIAEVLYRASGRCENCGQMAPFYRKSDFTPYLEIHYKVPFETGGEDSVENAQAVCPNCHMKLLYGY